MINLEGKEESLALSASAGQPGWSPAADIAYVSNRNAFSVSPGGGAPKLLAEAPAKDQEILWPTWT